MSFKEIKELRQAGKLDEALQMANQALETEPENIWNNGLRMVLITRRTLNLILCSRIT